MRPFNLGITTLMQGIYALLWVIVLFDVASPAFNLDGMPEWSGMQSVVAFVVLLTAAVALGVVMHTISKGLLHPVKLRWILEVLSSDSVKKRMAALGATVTFPGGPSYAEVTDPENASRGHAAAAFMYAASYSVMSRAYDVYRTIDVYRDQYRLARGFILPSAAFAIILPLWEPIKALDAVGAIGPFPIIRTQLFLLALLAAAVSFAAFRERSYRYAAATILAFATLEGQRNSE